MAYGLTWRDASYGATDEAKALYSFFGSQWWTEQIQSLPVQNLDLAHYLSRDHLCLNSHELISLMVRKDDAYIL